MSENPKDESFSESDLSSTEYRERLTRKLNCLIALLEVAIARVRRSLAGPDPDMDRLIKIRKNLQSTLDVCLRARTALERHEALPDDLPESLSQVARPADPKTKHVLRPKTVQLPAGCRHELGSLEEVRKFQRMGKVTDEEIKTVDIDDLTRKLQGL